MLESNKTNKPEKNKTKEIDRNKVNTVGFVFMLPLLPKPDKKDNS